MSEVLTTMNRSARLQDESPRETRPMPRIRLLGIVPAAVTLVLLYFAYPNAVPDFRPDQEHDSFIYIDLGKSITEGEGYPTKHWMPGFPLLLGTAIKILGLDFLRLKLVMIVASLFSLAVCFFLFRNFVNHNTAMILALLVGATPIYFDYSHRLMSEVPFLTFSLLGLVALVEVARIPQPSLGRLAAWTVILIIMSSAAFLVRGNALALAPAFLIAMLRPALKRPQRLALGLALASLLVTFSLWTVRCSGVTFQGIHNVTYMQEIQAEDIGALWAADGYDSAGGKVDLFGLFDRVRRNVGWYISYRVAAVVAPTAEGLTSLRIAYLGFAIAAVLAIPVAIGTAYLVWRWPDIGVYLLCSLGLIIVYPTGGAPRMLIGSLPLLVLAAYLGIEQLLGSSAGVGWGLTAAWVSIIQCGIAAENLSESPYSYPQFADLVALLANDLPPIKGPAEAISAPHPGAVTALTEGRAVMSKREAFPQVLRGELQEILWIRRETDDSADSRELPPGLISEHLATRGEFVLSRVRSQPVNR